MSKPNDSQLLITPEDDLPAMKPNPEEIAVQSGRLALIDKAVMHGMNADAIAKLWDIQKDIEDRAARQAFMQAVSLFKHKPPEIKRTKHVKYDTKSGGRVDYWHVELDQACEQIIPALAKVGISHRWETSQSGEIITVTCVLTHEQGHSERTTLQGLPDDSGGKNKIQAVGSTVYYLERYTLLAATGLAPKGQDDDGRGGSTIDGFKRSEQQEKEYQDRYKQFDKCLNGQELEDHWRASRKWARDIKDEPAVKDFDSLKEKRKKELAK